MLKKMMNAHKNFILLRSILCVAMALVVVCSPLFALSASATSKEFLDYNDYLESVVVSDGYDNVKFTLPLSLFSCDIYNITDGNYSVMNAGTYMSAYLTAGKTYRITFYLPYLKIANIPDGTTINANLYISRDGVRAYPAGSLNVGASYFKKDGSFIVQKNNVVGNYSPAGDLVFDMSVASVPEAYGMQAFYQFNYVTISTSGTYTFTLTDCFFLASISSLYRQQSMFGETNELLDEVNKQLEQNGQKLDDIVNGVNKLPDQFGDEIQGVIDNEKQEAESSGQDLVDQILGALPDPSTGVLEALRALTDATAYTGTDAVLTIPAIVLPGVDGLFPETQIWGGAEFDFSEYLGFLPPALLTLVQSLFTIAIVLFCVYELKGIISYCLTLRENKGG